MGRGILSPFQGQNRDAVAPCLTVSTLGWSQVKLRTAFALEMSLADDCCSGEVWGFLFYFIFFSLVCSAMHKEQCVPED